MEECRETVYSLVRENTERAFATQSQSKDDSLGEDLSSGRMTPQEQIFHETAGWRNLETSIKCVKSMVVGCAAFDGMNKKVTTSFRSLIDQTLLDLVFATLEHENRFVRETGYQTIAALIEVCLSSDPQQQQQQHQQPDPILKFSDQLAQQLSKGLADNWSQVRMAATVACRHLLLGASQNQNQNNSGLEKVVSVLLPRLCLNRYYLADGVRIYSQDTWKMTVGSRGKTLVEEHISDYVDYYILCTKADNHAVREAACQCIAELAAKINREVVLPHVDVLLDALVECFHDESWPVRDMACVASGSFVFCFPEESRRVLPVLTPLFFSNLKDPISSVRQGAALSLAKTLKAYSYEYELKEELRSTIASALDAVEQQPVESHRYGDLSSDPANFGVVKKQRDNDPELHENQPMYSCGSLAPKMGRGGGGGCGDCKFRKPSEPWEAADGCLYLMAELSSLQGCWEMISNLLPKAAAATRFKHYTMHYSFLETVMKVLPTIGEGLGKRIFKPHLEDFFDAIFYCLASDNALASVAAEQCLIRLSKFLGPNILLGRVEQYNPRYVPMLESVQRSPGGPPSPFGKLPSHSPSAMTSPMSIPIPNARSGQPSLGGTPTGSPK